MRNILKIQSEGYQLESGMFIRKVISFLFIFATLKIMKVLKTCLAARIKQTKGTLYQNSSVQLHIFSVAEDDKSKKRVT